MQGHLLRVWGRYTSGLLLVLVSSSDPVPARELAFNVGLDSSRKVYPLLRYWVRRGVVVVSKPYRTVSLYSVRDEVKRALRRALELYAHARPYELKLRRLERLVESRLLRRLKPVERELLALLLQLLLDGGSRYLRVRGSYAEALAKLADTLRRRLERAGLSAQQVAKQLYMLRESLEELAEHHIIYLHYDSRSQALVIALDRSLDNVLEV